MPTHVLQHGGALVEFECRSCGFVASAQVQSEGHGNLSSVQGRDAGYQAADQDFYENAYRTLDCVPCPRCRYLDAARVRSIKMRAFLGATLPFVLFMLLVWWFMGSETDATTLQAMALVGGGMLVLGGIPIFLTLRSRSWGNAEARVAFAPAEVEATEH